MNVLVLGSGLLAWELATVFEKRGCKTFLRSRRDGWDVTMELPRRYLPYPNGDSYPGLIVNAAAYTNVDAAEEDALNAFRVNALGAENVARRAHDWGARLVHVSTDSVFHLETEGAGRSELDTPVPRSVYGRSKLLGEKLAAQAYPDTTVVRLANTYGSHGKNWGSRLRARLLDREELMADAHRVVAPTWARWPAEVIYDLFVTQHVPVGGLYHACPKGLTTWRGFAYEVASALGLKNAGIRAAEIPYKAPRGHVCALDSHMLPLRGIDIPTWEELLFRYLDERV